MSIFQRMKTVKNSVPIDQLSNLKDVCDQIKDKISVILSDSSRWSTAKYCAGRKLPANFLPFILEVQRFLDEEILKSDMYRAIRVYSHHADGVDKSFYYRLKNIIWELEQKTCEVVRLLRRIETVLNEHENEETPSSSRLFLNFVCDLLKNIRDVFYNLNKSIEKSAKSVSDLLGIDVSDNDMESSTSEEDEFSI